MEFNITHRSFMKGIYGLVVLFAVLCAAATFIENEWGTLAAWRLIYDAWYFKGLAALLALGLVLGVIRYRLWTPSKWLVGLFHLAFCLVLAGYGVTRYFGTEGTLHLRENQSSNRFVSSRPVLWWQATLGEEVHKKEEARLFSSLGTNHYSDKITFQDQSLTLRLQSYLQNAVRQIVPDPEGDTYLFLSAIEEGHNQIPLILKKGEIHQIGGLVVGFDSADPRIHVQITLVDSMLTFQCAFPVHMMSMKTRKRVVIPADSPVLFESGVLYQVGSVQLALNKMLEGGRSEWISLPKGHQGGQDFLVFALKTKDQNNEEVVIPVHTDQIGDPSNVQIGPFHVRLYYGLREQVLPFALKLTAFEVGWYGASDRPSSFLSKGFVQDSLHGELPFTVAMNRVFQYQGYRFFQSSYDADQKGSILSVQKDPGAPITYVGYFLSVVAMVGQLFRKKSRFRVLGSQIRDVALLALLSTLFLGAPTLFARESTGISVSPSLANSFGSLLVQDVNGRVKPLNTLSEEIMMKLRHDKKGDGYNADQLVLGILSDAQAWQHVPLVHLPHASINHKLGLPEKKSFAAFTDFFDSRTGAYQLQPFVNEAMGEKSSERNASDKAVLKVDERVHILYLLLQHRFIRCIPGEERKWLSLQEALSDSADTPQYHLARRLEQFLAFSQDANTPTTEVEFLDIQKAQRLLAGDQAPAHNRLKAELLLNRLQIFERMMPVTMGLGSVLLVLSLISLLSSRTKLNRLFLFAPFIIGFLLVIEGAGLILRGYVSGHAPWSNGYESMIYMAWTTLLAGLLFSRRWPLPLAVSTLFSGFILLVAHLSWMDPQITPLVPVLKSYWLTIHVSVIMISYGCFGMAAILSWVALVVMMIKPGSRKFLLQKQVHILTLISERTVILGLVFLYIGTVFGSVWANESWGRYWGWDAKETWTLITLCLYTLVVHLYLLVEKNLLFWKNALILLSFGSVLMTYFGVNYYLSGLHSYAQGSGAPLWILFVTGLVWGGIVVGSFFCRTRWEQNTNPSVF